MARTALVCLALLVGAVVHAGAQDRPTVEIEAGAGYAVGGGVEDPAPSIGTLTFGGTVWLTRSWGLAFAYVISHGEDRRVPLADGSDRAFLGLDDLRYIRTGVRHRRTLWSIWTLELGAGLVAQGSFDRITQLTTPTGPVRLDTETTFGGLAGEAYLRRPLGAHFAVRAGATYDTNFETTVFQPAILGVVAF